MGNLTKGQKAAEERIKEAIMRNYRLGICDSEGRSMKDRNGRPVKKPRNLGPTARKIV